MRLLSSITAGLLVIAAMAAAVAAQEEKPRSIGAMLLEAYANEKIAENRYTAFAAKAEEEGYRGAASLFRANAKSESVHAARFAALLKKRGLTPEDPVYDPTVKSTRENLLAAIEVERSERDGIYLDCVRDCKEAGDKEAANLFDLTRTTETEHANLCTIVNATLEDQKQPKTYHVCTWCGYTTDVKLPRCPSCMSQKSEWAHIH